MNGILAVPRISGDSCCCSCCITIRSSIESLSPGLAISALVANAASFSIWFSPGFVSAGESDASFTPIFFQGCFAPTRRKAQAQTVTTDKITQLHRNAFFIGLHYSNSGKFWLQDIWICEICWEQAGYVTNCAQLQAVGPALRKRPRIVGRRSSPPISKPAARMTALQLRAWEGAAPCFRPSSSESKCAGAPAKPS
jgi:hypothetical protein